MDEPPFSWGRFDPRFVEDLARHLAGRKVLEVFAGNGLLASRLADRGVVIVATSLLSSTDAHERGLYHPVLTLDAEVAVRRLGEGMDVLLMAWPPANGAALRALSAWGEHRPFVFVGEVTDLGAKRLGGCADDGFFANVAMERPLTSYMGRNVLDRAFVGRARFAAPEPDPMDGCPAFRR